MSHNLRFDNRADGIYRWERRVPAVKQVWEEIDADIIGTQEGLGHQVDKLKQIFKNYKVIGRGRNKDGSGEQVAVFYRQDRFTCLDSGHFWLSDTPEEAGSMSFGNNVCRMASWAVLSERINNKKLIFLNTHLDHESRAARINSARLICKFLAEDPAVSQFLCEGIFVSGDFNDTPDSESIQLMKREGELQDALEVGGEIKQYIS